MGKSLKSKPPKFDKSELVAAYTASQSRVTLLEKENLSLKNAIVTLKSRNARLELDKAALIKELDLFKRNRPIKTDLDGWN